MFAVAQGIDRPLADNLILAENGSSIYEVSSEMPKGEATNILTSVRKDLWITQQAPPQYLVIDVSQLHQRPDAFNLFGLDCWHDYPTNPSRVELLVSNDAVKYSSLGRFQIDRTPGWQYFRLPAVAFAKCRFLKLTILENHGGEKTYLNQAMIGWEQRQPPTSRSHAVAASADPLSKFLPQEEEPLSAQPTRDKAMSSAYMKMTSTERQLKKVSDKVRNLEQENASLKEKVKKQDQAIQQMQTAMAMLTRNLERVQHLVENDQRLYSSEGLLDRVSERQQSQIAHSKGDNTKQQPAVISSRRMVESHYHDKIPSKDPFKESKEVRRKSAVSKKQSDDSEEQSQQRYRRDPNTSDDVDLKRTKILPLLEQLQLKLAEKSKLQQKLGSPRRTKQLHPGESESSEEYQQ